MSTEQNGEEISQNPDDQPKQPNVEPNQTKRELIVKRFFNWLKTNPGSHLVTLIVGNVLGKVAAKVVEKLFDKFF